MRRSLLYRYAYLDDAREISLSTTELASSASHKPLLYLFLSIGLRGAQLSNQGELHLHAIVQIRRVVEAREPNLSDPAIIVTGQLFASSVRPV